MSKRPDWIIEPRLGAGPLCFGMGADEVAALLGPPESVKPLGNGKGRPLKGSFTEFRKDTKTPVLTYGAGKLQLIDFLKSANTLSLDGLLLFSKGRQAIIDELIEKSTAVFEDYEGYMFLDFGLVMRNAKNARGSIASGHWNIGVFTKGYFDQSIRGSEAHDLGRFLKGPLT